MAVARGAVAVITVGTNKLVTLTDKDAVAVLDAGVVTPGGGAITGLGVGHGGEVVEGATGPRLSVRVFSAVELKDVVTQARALAGITGISLNDQAKLSAATPSLVAVEGVVTNVPDGHVLQGDGAAPDFDAIINIVHNFNVVDLGVATQSAQGESIEFVGQANHSTAVAERQVEMLPAS